MFMETSRSCRASRSTPSCSSARSTPAIGGLPRVPARLEHVLPDGDRVAGARWKTLQGPLQVTDPCTVLATGTVLQPMLAAGLREQRTPSGAAIRGCVRDAAMVERSTQLRVVWHKRLGGWPPARRSVATMRSAAKALARHRRPGS